jgi:Gram-negative bacterial TonB protein C-terminal
VRVLDRSTRWQAALVASTFVLAISIAAIPFLTSHANRAQASTAWPHSEGRVFDMSSEDAWHRVQDRLKALGLEAEKTDGKNRLLLTKPVYFGDRRSEWLARPKLSQQFASVRTRFEVFVSPFVEPARLYVGSVTELHQTTGKASQAILYNDPTVNTALLRQLAKGLRQDGFPIPASREERQKLTASLLKGRPDECVRRIESCRVSSSRLDKPEKLALSEFEVVFPEQAAREKVEAPVVVQLDVSEDGAVVGGQVLGSRRGDQLEVSAAGATSLLVFSPLRLCGCPAPHMTVYTIDYRLH